MPPRPLATACRRVGWSRRPPAGLVLVGGALLVTAGSWVAAAPARAGAGVSSSTTTIAPGPGSGGMATVYLRDCGVCHGADGRGTARGPSLVGVGAAAVDYWVSTGRMPLYGGIDRAPKSAAQFPQPGYWSSNPKMTPRRHRPVYPPAVVAALAAYVSDLTGGGPAIPVADPAGGDVARGGELFRLDCAACHSWGGDGGALLHVEAPSLHQATPVQVAEAVRIGPGTMPAFGTAAVSDAQLADLVAYVTTLDHPDNRGGNALWHIGPVAEGGFAIVVGLGLMLMATRWIGERG